MPALLKRYPRVLREIIEAIGREEANTPCLTELRAAWAHFSTIGLHLPTWQEVAQGARPPRQDLEETDPGEWKHGWQYFLSDTLHRRSRDALIQAARPRDAARYRSCQGRHNARWLTTVPTSEALTLCNPIHQCLLRWRLGLPILSDAEVCEGRRCRAILDELGHHRSACMRTGRVHARHAAALNPWKQVLEEAGYRIRTERLLRDTHLRTTPQDMRRMDMVAAPGARSVGARRGVALFCDVTICSTHKKNGEARPGAANIDGATISQAVRKKQRRYSDVVNSPQAALVVLGCEAYGRWCEHAVSLVREMAKLKARQAPRRLQTVAEHAWSNRWWGIIGVGVQRAIAESLIRHGGVDLQQQISDGRRPALADFLSDI